MDYWGIDYVHCYDPSYAKYSTLPLGPFDGVICTDVLEHCPEDDLPWIVTEIFAYAENFVYANVACYPAMKRFPTGENAHCTVRAPEWWARPLPPRSVPSSPDVDVGAFGARADHGRKRPQGRAAVPSSSEVST